MSEHTGALRRHYAPPHLVAALLDGLHRAGKDVERLQPDDLAPVDQFHTRGKRATVELAVRARVQPGERVLDVGGGLGGPARTLAAEFGAQVTVLDLTEAYCRAGAMLTERTGLRDAVGCLCGDALELPFDTGSFDVAWMQHANMNIDDKARLYRELGRVLRPEGRLALHEVAAGAVQPVRFPVPWASDPAASFLRPLAELRALIERSGFVELALRDVSGDARAWFRQRLAASPAGPTPLGLHLLLGRTFEPALRNMLANLEEGRIAVFEAVYHRRSKLAERRRWHIDHRRGGGRRRFRCSRCGDRGGKASRRCCTRSAAAREEPGDISAPRAGGTRPRPPRAAVRVRARR